MVEWIREGNEACVQDDSGDDVPVSVVNATPSYIRTYADGISPLTICCTCRGIRGRPVAVIGAISLNGADVLGE